jgi:hypothetical protein
MARKGFQHQARPTAGGDWEVLFSRATQDAHPTSAASGPAFLQVDARGLEPPQPLVTILEALATLPPAAGLRARTDRRPMHLYAQLEARGFVGETQEEEDGSFITRIRRL